MHAGIWIRLALWGGLIGAALFVWFMIRFEYDEGRATKIIRGAAIAWLLLAFGACGEAFVAVL